MEDLIVTNGAEGEKTRAFSATLLTLVLADNLWDQSKGGTLRPVLLSVASTEEEMRAFLANLRMGRKVSFATGRTPDWANYLDAHLEVLKTSGFRWTSQRFEGGVVVTTGFYPDLFTMDPGMVDPEKGIRFCLLPPSGWVVSDQEVTEVSAYMVAADLWADSPGELARFAVLAPLFMAYLDRRTRCPLLTDRRFALQLLVACLRKGLATVSCERRSSRSYYTREPFGELSRLGYMEVRPEAAGYQPGLAFLSDHETFERILAQEVATFLSVAFY